MFQKQSHLTFGETAPEEFSVNTTSSMYMACQARSCRSTNPIAGQTQRALLPGFSTCRLVRKLLSINRQSLSSGMPVDLS